MAKKYDIGVIIGRFQVPALHDAHKQVIKKMIDDVKNPLVLVGISPALGTKSDPLDFTTRKHMLLEAFPTLHVFPLMDRPTNEEWSNDVDRLIRTVFPFGAAALYGGRDSFIRSYKGRHKTVKLPTIGEDNGTDIRKDTGTTVRSTEDFRAGIIYATQNQYAKVHPTVDIAFISDRDNEGHDGLTVLLGRKEPGKLYHFPGGFVDPTDKSLEDAARRELKEETAFDGGQPGPFSYLGSFLIDDWRYQKDDQRIITSFFKTEFQPRDWQSVEKIAADGELADLHWMPVTHEMRDQIVPHHQVLWDALLKNLKIKPAKTPLMEDEVRPNKKEKVRGK